MPYSESVASTVVDALNANPARAVGPISNIDVGVRMRLTGYHPALDDSEEVLTLMDQGLEDYRDVIPFDNRPYPSFREVSLFLVSRLRDFC